MIIRRRQTKLKKPPPCLPTWSFLSEKYAYPLSHLSRKLQVYTEQVDRLVVRRAQTLYVIRTLRIRGLYGQRTWEVTQSTFLSQFTYASQEYGTECLMLMEKRGGEVHFRRQSNKVFCPRTTRVFAETCDEEDRRLFKDMHYWRTRITSSIISCHLSS